MNAHVRDQLSAYLDGELSPSERALVDEHLGGCEACARRLEALGAVDAAARELPAEPPPGYFEAFPSRVRRRLESRAREHSWRLPVWAWTAAAAALLAVVTPLTLMRARPTAVSPKAELALPAPGGAGALRPVPTDAPRATAPVTLAPPRLPAAARPLAQRQASPPTAAFAPAPPTAAPEREEARPSAGAEALGEEPAADRAAPVFKKARPPVSGEAQATDRDELMGTSGGRVVPKAASRAPLEADRAFRALLARSPLTATEARELREAWRSFSLLYPEGTRADEARVRVVEAGAQAYRLGSDPADRARLREDARAYLERTDAAQAARVRAALEGLGLEP